MATFGPAEIDAWVDDDQTALCPKCGIDSVVGSDSGWLIDVGFLTEMHRAWFLR